MPKLDKFRIFFLGAAQTVTGSMHPMEVGDSSVFVDCCLFLGRFKESTHRLEFRHFQSTDRRSERNHQESVVEV